MEKLHMQFDVIMGLDFYVFQNILESYAKILEDRREEEEKEAKKHGYDESKFSPNGMISQAQKNMPTMPKMPNMQIPKF